MNLRTNGDTYIMELLLIPAAIASGCHRPLLRWWKTARPCTAKVSANGSELRAICGRLVVITARIKCTAVVVLDAVACNKFCRQNSENTNVTDSPQRIYRESKVAEGKYPCLSAWYFDIKFQCLYTVYTVYETLEFSH